MPDKSCQHKIKGRLGEYCPVLFSHDENASCDEEGTACFAWNLACTSAKVSPPIPNLERNTSKLSTEHAVDAMISTGSVLVVEDSVVSMKVLEKTLGALGKDMLKAGNGIEALDIIGEGHDVRLVLLDLMMPEMDGLEFMQELRKLELPPEKSFPILVVSDLKDWEMTKEVMRFGALGSVKKPYSKGELWLAMENVLFSHRENLKIGVKNYSI